MKTPKRIEPLIEDGLVDEVLRPLMSGKEAAVYVVRCGNELRCAKVYKEANKRSFRQASEYQEGRKVRNSRQALGHRSGLTAVANLATLLIFGGLAETSFVSLLVNLGASQLIAV